MAILVSAWLDFPIPKQISSPSRFSSRKKTKTRFLLHFTALECADWSISSPHTASNFCNAVTTSGVKVGHDVSFLMGNIRLSVFSFQCPWLILARDASMLSSAQLECCCWWFSLLRKSLAAVWEQGQDPYDCLLLRSSIFPRLLDILFFIQQQCYVPILSTNHNLLHSAVACIFALLALLWSGFPSRRSLEAEKFLPVPSRAASWGCERSRFLCYRVMSAASERTLLNKNTVFLA